MERLERAVQAAAERRRRRGEAPAQPLFVLQRVGLWAKAVELEADERRVASPAVARPLRATPAAGDVPEIDPADVAEVAAAVAGKR
jgi:hypothetical protein